MISISIIQKIISQHPYSSVWAAVAEPAGTASSSSVTVAPPSIPGNDGVGVGPIEGVPSGVGVASGVGVTSGVGVGTGVVSGGGVTTGVVGVGVTTGVGVSRGL